MNYLRILSYFHSLLSKQSKFYSTVYFFYSRFPKSLPFSEVHGFPRAALYLDSTELYSPCSKTHSHGFSFLEDTEAELALTLFSRLTFSITFPSSYCFKGLLHSYQSHRPNVCFSLNIPQLPLNDQLALTGLKITASSRVPPWISAEPIQLSSSFITSELLKTLLSKPRPELYRGCG